MPLKEGCFSRYSPYLTTKVVVYDNLITLTFYYVELKEHITLAQ